MGRASEVDDAALVAATRADRQAFTALYERYLVPVYRCCYVRLGSREEAEDATSTVFLKAMAGLSGYRGGSFPAWLFRIARNVLIDLERGRRPTQTLDERRGAADPGLQPEEALLARAESRALRAALARLPEVERAAVELKLAGWSGQEIADALGKSVAAVKMDRLRGLRRLRALLAEVQAQSVEVDDDPA